MSRSDPQLQPLLDFASVGSASLALLWEWAVTFDDEVGLIWSKPNDSWLKWLFLFARYYILIASLVSRFMEAMVVYRYPLSWSCMKIWYSCQVVVALHATISLELVLMTRVYALYNRQRWMRNLFAGLLLAENVVVLIGMFVHYPGSDFLVRDTVTKLPTSFSYYAFCTLVIQFVIMYFTLSRYVTGSWKSVPIVQLMFRDGTLAFFVITLLVLIIAIYTINGKTFAIAGFAWMLSAVSSVTCRLIINMLKLPQGSDSYTDASTSIQFTTIFRSISSRLQGSHRSESFGHPLSVPGRPDSAVIMHSDTPPPATREAA